MSGRGARSLGTGLLMASVLAACTGSDARHGVERYDSAGVEVVVNPDPAVRPPELLPVSSEPVLEIGEEGRPDYEFFRIRGVHPVTDERILVVNAGTNELRYYSDDGVFLHAVGGDGEGPGEFRSLSAVYLRAPDSLAATDARLRRISIFDENGRLGRAVRFRPTIPGLPEGVTLYVPAHVLGVFSDGSVLCSLYDLIFAPSGAGWAENERHLARWIPETDSIVRIGVFPVTDYFRRGQDDYPLPLFVRTVRHAVHGDRIIVSTARRYEVRIYAPNGTLNRLIREDRPPTPVGEDVVSRLTEDREERDPGDEQEAPPVPEALPTYTGVLLDDSGALWAELYTFPDQGYRRWAVFDPTGARVGTVEVPRSFRLSSVRGNRLYGWDSDEVGVQRVRVYEVAR